MIKIAVTWPISNSDAICITELDGAEEANVLYNGSLVQQDKQCQQRFCVALTH